MFRQIATAATLLLAGASALAEEGQVIRMGDAAMSCEQIVGEANAASDVLGGSPEGGVFASEQAINAATGLGQQAVIMSGAGSAVGGLGAIGAVGGLFSRAAAQRKEADEARRKVAQSRWYYLNGLYSGRQCDQVLAAKAAAEPAGEVQAAAAPAS